MATTKKPDVVAKDKPKQIRVVDPAKSKPPKSAAVIRAKMKNPIALAAITKGLAALTTEMHEGQPTAALCESWMAENGYTRRRP